MRFFEMSSWKELWRLIGSIIVIMALVACGDDKGSSPEGLPDEVANMDELEEYKCDDSVIGSVIYVKSKSKNYECDGDEWLVSQNQSKSSSSKKSSSSSAKSSSSSGQSIAFKAPCNVKTDENCFEDSRDGQTYRIAKVGGQIWMAENLNYETERSYWISNSGSFSNQKISELKDIDTSKYKYPITKFGRYYFWSEAMDSAGVWSSNGKGCGNGKICAPVYPVRGICPDGWHLPTITEYEILFVNVNIGGDGETGFALKSSYGWSDDGGGIDAYGFTALPVGYASSFGEEFGSSAYFWSSTDSSRGNAGCIEMGRNVGNAVPQFTHKDKGFPIRCVKD